MTVRFLFSTYMCTGGQWLPSPPSHPSPSPFRQAIPNIFCLICPHCHRAYLKKVRYISLNTTFTEVWKICNGIWFVSILCVFCPMLWERKLTTCWIKILYHHKTWDSKLLSLLKGQYNTNLRTGLSVETQIHSPARTVYRQKSCPVFGQSWCPRKLPTWYTTHRLSHQSPSQLHRSQLSVQHKHSV